MKKTIALLLALLTALSLCACGAGSAAQSAPAPADAPEPFQTVRHAEITIRDYGTVKLELDEGTAPITVANFIALAQSGFYDGLTFHRIMDGFMIQGGDPTGTGSGGSSEKIKGEFSSNGVPNGISHVEGVISMARASDPDSASSQFFITVADASFLDGSYAAFGRVIEGVDVVDAIAGTPTGYQDRPVQEQRIKKATVDTFGESYKVEKYGH
jgi:peptidyl-prolyl cis-trans isomerase B (cyclophilin B)